MVANSPDSIALVQSGSEQVLWSVSEVSAGRSASSAHLSPFESRRSVAAAAGSE